MQLDAEILGSIPGITDDQKRMLIMGEVAEEFMRSSAWKMLLDWAENRCNYSLAKLKDAAFANQEAQRAFLQLWRVNEDWMRDVQIYFKGLVADRDAVLADYASIAQDMPVQDVVPKSSTTPRVENS